MKVYTVLYHKKVERDLKKIPVPIRFTIEKAIYSLREFDKAKSILDIKTLKGYKNLWRLRVGKYRILFEKDDDKIMIFVIKISTRGDAYKSL